MLGARPEEMANAAAEQFECNYGKRTIPRGGLCVHRPVAYIRKAAPAPVSGAHHHDLHDDYLTFTRNIFLQTPQPRGELSIDQIWDDAAEKKFGQVALTASSSVSAAGKKKGRKRKAEEDNGGNAPTPPIKTEDEDVDGGGDNIEAKPAAGETLLNQPQQQEQEHEETLLPMCGLEDDERMLSFLQANHGGDIEKAKFSIMVNSDRGYGMSLGTVENVACGFVLCCVLSSHHNFFPFQYWQPSKGGDN
jgi:hypothetical protein